MATVKSLYKSMFPSKPTFTDSNLPSQRGKVFLITGGNGGLGQSLGAMLYAKDAKVYIAARSEAKAQKTINEIKALHPASAGELVFLKLDLSDLTTIKASAKEFLAKESRLDVLWNNAGVMVPPQGSNTVQGYELQVGTNNIAPFLFTELLQPVLLATARMGEARVVWTSSSAGYLGLPNPIIDFNNMDYKREEGIWTKYGRSKAGNILHCVEYARRSDKANIGILHTAVDPGWLKTGLQRSTPAYQAFLINMVLSEPKFGAYTLLFAGLHPSITKENNGVFVAPPGRLINPGKDILDKDLGQKYWEWTEKQIEHYR
ncbi:related to dehydrogenases with different specificities (related to short-chain alcohol dehydrogenases) [Phialocephala subalpina]|uniref:Related to dehydrogenases with different specificities (Related to short-chain alcohol dehydrogenases) n=1 Tax=Phialocephala subalpina TaxID=576137 RepID=A0A1L7XYN9_9HELO|nr:related to dehydrogenases with different specificities (related to short-chain alcohol dehydrogenases) [Phialocephala subalpina]